MEKLILTLVMLFTYSTFGAAKLIGTFKISSQGSHANGRPLKSGTVSIYDVRTKEEKRDDHWVQTVKPSAFKPHLHMFVTAEYAAPQSASDHYYGLALLPYDQAPVKDRGDWKVSGSGGDFEYFSRSGGDLEVSRVRVEKEHFELHRVENLYELQYGKRYQSYRYVSGDKYELDPKQEIEAMGLVLIPGSLIN